LRTDKSGDARHALMTMSIPVVVSQISHSDLLSTLGCTSIQSRIITIAASIGKIMSFPYHRHFSVINIRLYMKCTPIRI
jgi:hypothetical protein